MYTKTDASMLLVRVGQAAALAKPTSSKASGTSRLRTKPAAASAAAVSDGRLSYAAFLQVLLEFQLSGHLRYLSSFVQLFRQLDTHGRGVLDEEQFRELAYALNPDEDVADDHLAHIDPFNHQRLNFSDCVTCFTADLVRLQQQQQAGADDDVNGFF